MDENISKYLENIYFKTNQAGSYGGIDQLYRTVRN